jgi:hypothetical protein
MTMVQITHGWDKRDTFALLTKFSNSGAQGVDLFCD